MFRKIFLFRYLSKLRNYFLAGIVITAPIGITLYVSYVIINFVDERVRKLLQGVAKLEFWEVAELSEQELSRTLQLINQFLLTKEKESKIIEKDDSDESDLAELLIDAVDTSLVSDYIASEDQSVLDSLQNSFK